MTSKAFGNAETFVQAGAGAVARTVQDKERDIVSVKDFGAKGDGTTDDTTAINAANTYAASLSQGGTVFFPPGNYKTTANISIPNKVSWEGTTYPNTNTAGTTWITGATIWKCHTSDGISMISSNLQGEIRNIGIWTDPVTYPGGNGFVIGPAAGCLLTNCVARSIKGDSFVIGDNTTNSFTNMVFNCYSNNPGGRGFVIAGQWFRGNILISDGGTIGHEVLSSGNDFSIGEVHHEGFSSAGIQISASRGTYFGKNILLANTALNTANGINVRNVSGAQDVTFLGFTMIQSNSGAGIGLNIAGSFGLKITLRDSLVQGWATGAYLGGNYSVIDGNDFSACALPINANANYYSIRDNTITGTTGSYSIAHNAGTIGLWENNTLDKTINAVLSGVAGNFSGIIVRNNSGYVTRQNGQTGSITSGSTVTFAAALAANWPSGTNATFQTFTGGVTSFPYVTSPTASNFVLNWTGTANVQWTWTVNLPCDP